MPFIKEYDVVLHRLGGSELLLERLLSKFLDSYRDAGSQLAALLAEGRHEEAYRLVHSIKGVSSNLGLDGIYRASADLELALKAESAAAAAGAVADVSRESAAYTRELDAFTGELDAVIGYLDSPPKL